jgi:hypothetical protein
MDKGKQRSIFPGNQSMVEENRYPYRGGFLIARRHGQGWQIDMEIDNQVIDSIYTNSLVSSKEQAIQEATKVANDIISSRSRPVP